MSPNVRLFVIGHIGSRNVGDDAICVSFVNALSRLSLPIDKVYVQSNGNYLDTQLVSSSLDVVVVKRLPQIIYAFIRSKYIILNGGDYLDDYGSIATRIRSLSLILGISLLTRALGKQFMMVNTGIRSHSLLSNWFLTIILAICSNVSVRDASSLKLIKMLDRNKGELGFDTAVLHQYFTESELNHMSTKSENRKRIMGVSLTPFGKNFFSKNSLDSLIAKKFTQALNGFLKKWDDVHLWFFSYNSSERAGDISSIMSVVGGIEDKYQSRLKIIVYNGDIQAFLSEIRRVDLMVTCKYHSIVFAFIMNKPMITFLYHPKCLAIHDEIRLHRDSKISINQVLDNSLPSLLDHLYMTPKRFISLMPPDEAQMRALHGIRWCLDFQEKS